MARKLTTNQDINNFITKVIGEAHHHGNKVDLIIQPLSAEIRRRLNLNSDKVEVYERDGNLARTCWFTLQGARYVLSYNYRTEKIELRDRSIQGAVRFEFDNATSLADIQREVGML